MRSLEPRKRHQHIALSAQSSILPPNNAAEISGKAVYSVLLTAESPVSGEAMQSPNPVTRPSNGADTATAGKSVSDTLAFLLQLAPQLEAEAPPIIRSVLMPVAFLKELEEAVTSVLCDNMQM